MKLLRILMFVFILCSAAGALYAADAPRQTAEVNIPDELFPIAITHPKTALTNERFEIRLAFVVPAKHKLYIDDFKIRFSGDENYAHLKTVFPRPETSYDKFSDGTVRYYDKDFTVTCVLQVKPVLKAKKERKGHIEDLLGFKPA